MKRRDFLNTTALASLALSFGSYEGFAQTKANEFPNIVLILADDMGYGDLTCLNPDSKIPTPNMDRIAKEGLSFTDAHSPSAVCTPTRYGLLTGRYSWRTRLKSGVLWGWSPPLINPERMTLASMLKKRGYHTGCVGKWHLGLGWQTKDGKTLSDSNNESGENVDYSQPITGGPTDLGFDYFFGIPASLDMQPYCYIENNHVVQEPTETIERSGYPAYYRGGPISPDFKHEDVMPTCTKKAVNYIHQRAENPEQSFFLYVPLSAPHTPWVPKDYAKEKSRAGIYGDFVYQVDLSVGKILDALDQHGFDENTLVILTSDNGSHEDHIGKHNNGVSTGEINFGHEANYVFRGQKADAWDGGHRIPFLARWPKRIKAGSSSDETICLTDFMATFAELTSVPLPDNAAEDSYNILPVLTNQDYDAPIREATIHHSLSGMFCVRQGPWKLILGRGSGGFTNPRHLDPKEGEPEGQLYNLEEDISESNNLYQEHPEIVERLTNLLNQYKEQGYSRPM